MKVKSFEFKELIAQSTDTGKPQQMLEPMKRKNKNKDPAKKRMKNVAEFDDNDDAAENDSAPPPNDFAPVREFVPAKEFVAKEYVAKEQTIVDDDMSRFD